MSQLDLILNYLKSGERINKIIAIQKFNCFDFIIEFIILLLSKNTGGKPPRQLRLFSFKRRVSRKRELMGSSCRNRQNSAFSMSKITGVML